MQNLDVRVVRSTRDLEPGSIVVLTVAEGDELQERPEIISLGGERLEQALAQKAVKRGLYEMTLLDSVSGSISLALVGLGKREDIDSLRLMRATSAATRYVTSRGWRRLGVVDRDELPANVVGQAVTEGVIRGTYDPGIKKTRDRPERRVETFSIVSDRDADIRHGARIGQIVGEASSLARDLVNLPANELTPTAMAERAREQAAANDLECEVLDESAMRELGMGALLGVAAGSAQPPRLIILRYGDPQAETRLALVGKGLTFDSGGLSLKTAEGMETMKCDMGGGAAVLAGMVAVARLAPKGISVTGYIGATENMPGGAAMRPGDVLTALNGETIEVLNTDAEGRIVLADVLSLACQRGATHVVDFATLTGAAVVALGYAATLASGKPAGWVARVVRAGDAGFDRAWQMPLFEEYRRAMDSEVADIKNTGGRAGGALTATAFLSDFVDGPQWAHLDIAGTAFSTTSSPYQPVGGTGAGVGTIAALVLDLAGASAQPGKE